MNNKPNDTKLIYDSCTYSEKLKRTVGPGLYMLNTPNNDCTRNNTNISTDPNIRYQKYGPATCSIKSTVDDSSELQGLNYKLSKCNKDQYVGNYNITGNCDFNMNYIKDNFFAPQEDTRLSNPVNNLRGTGINRWEWLCENPQDNVLEPFDRIPVNYKMVAKDNHVPFIEKPLDQQNFNPNYKNDKFEDNINKWAINDATNLYAPGYPFGNINYNLECKNKI